MVFGLPISTLFAPDKPRGREDDAEYLRRQAAEILTMTGRSASEDNINRVIGIFHEVTHHTALQVSEIMWNRVEQWESRLAPLMERVGAHLDAFNGKYVRQYVHGTDLVGSDVRLAYVEAKIEMVDRAIEAYMDALPTQKRYRKLMSQAQSIAKLHPQLEEIKKRNTAARTNLRDRLRKGIWYEGPEYVRVGLESLEEYFHLYEADFGDRMAYKFRRARKKDQEKKKERLKTTSRQRRVFNKHFTLSAEDTPKADLPRVSDLEFLQALQSELSAERAQLEEQFAADAAALEDLKKDIENLEAERDLEREIVTESRQQLAALARARRTLAAEIAAIDADAFKEEREAELQIAERKTAELPALSLVTKSDGIARELKEANEDLEPYLNSQDESIRTLAETIKTMRSEQLPLEARAEDLAGQTDVLTFKRTFVQREIAELKKLSDANEALMVELRIEQAQMEFLLEDLKAGHVSAKPAETSKYPSTLKELEPWVKANLHGRVVVLNKAARAAAKSVFERPEQVYAALEFLGHQYRDQKVAMNGSRVDLLNAFNTAASQLHLTIGSCFGNDAHAGKHVSDYQISYKNRTLVMDTHLARGWARNPRNTMRIYFTWDDAEKVVVVGHLPGHLSNRLD